MWLTCRRQHDFSRPGLRIPRIYLFLRVFLSPLSSLVSTQLFARFPKYDHSEVQRQSNRLFLLRELKKITHITINVPFVKLSARENFISLRLAKNLSSIVPIDLLFIFLISSDTIDIIKISPVFEETFKSNFLDLSSRNGTKKKRKKRKRRRRRRRKRKKRSRTVSRPGDKRSAINSGDSVEERITRRTS